MGLLRGVEDMKKIEFQVSIGIANASQTGVIEVEDDLSEEEIHEEVLDYIIGEIVDIDWTEVEE